LTTPKVSTELKIRHKTLTQRTAQLVKWLSRNFKGRPIKLIGDGAYSVIDLGLLAQQYGVTLIAPIRLDARLFEPAAPRVAGTKRHLSRRSQGFVGLF
jgi:hypothetical protein